MAISLNSGRQSPLFAYVDVSFADLASGVAQAAVKLPINAVVIGGALVVTEAFNSATSDAVEIGDDTLATRYLASTSVRALGRTAIAPTGFTTSAAEAAVNLKYTGVGAAASAGSLRLEVMYAIKGAADSSQG